MSTSVRKLALTAHVGASVGWLGAVFAFLALAVSGVTSANDRTVQSAYVAMHVITWAVIVPLCLASVASGVVQSLGTPWGLFRHYWVVMKLALTMLASVVLLVHTQPIDRLAAVAAADGLSGQELWAIRLQLIGDASAGLFVLAATTALSVYKPWGLTPYGLRMLDGDATRRRERASRAVSGRVALIGLGAVLLVIVLLHLFGVGLHAH